MENSRLEFVMLEKENFITKLNKRATLFNTVMIGILLALRVRKELNEYKKEKNQKGE